MDDCVYSNSGDGSDDALDKDPDSDQMMLWDISNRNESNSTDNDVQFITEDGPKN